MGVSQQRIALISDIHGNEIALREVLRSIDRLGADQVVCLGDVATLGVAPGEVIDMLERLGCRCILGNHDEYLLDPGLTDAHNSGDPMIVEAIDWCRGRVPGHQIQFVSSFEEGFELPLGGEHRLRLFHGSPDSNMVDLLADTSAATFDEQLGPDRSTVMAGGHTHIQMVRQHRGTLVVNPGSVGAPFREFAGSAPPRILDHAEFATVEFAAGDVSVALHRIALDRHELASAALRTSNPMGPALAAAYL